MFDSTSFAFFNTFAFTANFVIYVGLIVFWIRSVYDRLLPSYTRGYMIVEALFMIFYIVIRSVKYRIVGSVWGARACWYLYYIPIVMIPSFFLISAVSFGSTRLYDESESGRKKLSGRVSISILIVLFSLFLSGCILTNDIHNLAFIPNVPLEEFEGRSGTYSYGPLTYAVYAWVVVAVVVGVVYFVWLTNKVSNWRKIGFILIPLALVPAINELGAMLEEIGFERMYHEPEVYVFALIVILEICLRNRIISYNEDYQGIFSKMSIPAVITSSDFNSIYTTETQLDITDEEMQRALEAPVLINEDTRLFGMQIRGGNVFWTVDESEINRMNESLEEANETLDLENKLIKYEHDQKEERSRIDARNLVYRKAANTVYREQKRIEQILDDTHPGDIDFREKVAVVSLLNAFVKRKSNFVLTYSEDESISSREIYLAIEEMIRFTGYLGVLGSVENMSRGSFSYADTLSLYDTFLRLLEMVLDKITKLLVVITDDGIRMIMDYKEELVLESEDWDISSDLEGESLYVTVSARKGGEHG